MHRFLALGATLVVALALSGVAEAWSWPADGEVLRAFELGSDTYAAGQHRGIDVAGAFGSPVRAPAAGTITFAGSVPTHGRGVTILTADGYSVTLFHLESVGVVKGETVDEGATVGTMGSSGDAEHSVSAVHLGIRVADRSDGYVDPVGLLPARAVQQPVSPPAAPVVAPVATPVPAPTTPAPPVQPPPAAAAATPVATPPAVAPAPPAAVPPPVPPSVVVSPPAVIAPTPEPMRISAPATAPSGNAGSIDSSVDSAPPRDAGGIDVAAGSSHPVRRALTAPAVAAYEQLDPLTADAARAAPVGGEQPSRGGATRSDTTAAAATVGAGSAGQADVSRPNGAALRSVVESEARRSAVRTVVRGERALPPVARSPHPPSLGHSPAHGARLALGELADGPGALPASVEVRGPGTGLGLAELLAGLALLMLVAARIVMRVARRIGPYGAVLPDDADLLRQLDAAHRSRLHDGRGRRVRASSAAARP